MHLEMLLLGLFLKWVNGMECRAVRPDVGLPNVALRCCATDFDRKRPMEPVSGPGSDPALIREMQGRLVKQGE